MSRFLSYKIVGVMFAGSMGALKGTKNTSTFCFRHVKWKFGFWKRMGVPSPDYFPYIGTMREIKKRVMRYMYREKGLGFF